jgi:hypothetical protein
MSSVAGNSTSIGTYGWNVSGSVGDSISIGLYGWLVTGEPAVGPDPVKIASTIRQALNISSIIQQAINISTTISGGGS